MRIFGVVAVSRDLMKAGLLALLMTMAPTAIAGLFDDNLSTYEMPGPHTRSVLARLSIDSLAGRLRAGWSIRADANLLYMLLPGTVFLVQSDHVVLLQTIPRAADRALVRLVAMRPAADDRSDYWSRNHALTEETPIEAFEIGAAVEKGFAAGADRGLRFGRYEDALDAFNRGVEAVLGQGSAPHRLHG